MATTNKLLAEKVDRLGELKNARAKIEKEEKELKNFILETGKTEIAGNLFKCKISDFVTNRLDTGKIKNDMPETWIAMYTTVQTSTRVTVN
jgi:predicted phage-related endonuclease